MDKYLILTMFGCDLHAKRIFLENFYGLSDVHLDYPWAVGTKKLETLGKIDNCLEEIKNKLRLTEYWRRFAIWLETNKVDKIL